jgi:large subunit ribosomal protein L3
MSRLFQETGDSTPVTLIYIDNNRVTQIKTVDNDGYFSIQVTKSSQLQKRLNKSRIGHFKAADSGPGKGLYEFRCLSSDVVKGKKLEDLELGESLSVSDIFSVGDVVDVSGTTIGKGFAGTVKRHNFAMQDATHGNSLSHRAPGSTGQNQSPGRVFKGKKMAGHMGNVSSTVQNLEIVSLDNDKSVIAVKGSIPGAKSSIVKITKAIKKS